MKWIAVQNQEGEKVYQCAYANGYVGHAMVKTIETQYGTVVRLGMVLINSEIDNAYELNAYVRSMNFPDSNAIVLAKRFNMKYLTSGEELTREPEDSEVYDAITTIPEMKTRKGEIIISIIPPDKDYKEGPIYEYWKVKREAIKPLTTKTLGSTKTSLKKTVKLCDHEFKYKVVNHADHKYIYADGRGLSLRFLMGIKCISDPESTAILLVSQKTLTQNCKCMGVLPKGTVFPKF